MTSLSTPVAGASKHLPPFSHHFCLVHGVFTAIVRHLPVSTPLQIFRAFCGYAGWSECLVSIFSVCMHSTNLTIVDFFVCTGFGFLHLDILFNRIIVMELMHEKLEHLMHGMEFPNGMEEFEW